MISETQKHKIAELRAAGLSYDKIVKELKISKPTIIEAVKDMENLIQNLKSIELEALKEKLELTHKHKLETLSGLINKIKTELLERDLSDVSSDKLLDMYFKLYKENPELISALNFSYKEDNSDFIFDVNRKIEP